MKNRLILALTVLLVVAITELPTHGQSNQYWDNFQKDLGRINPVTDKANRRQEVRTDDFLSTLPPISISFLTAPAATGPKVLMAYDSSRSSMVFLSDVNGDGEVDSSLFFLKRLFDIPLEVASVGDRAGTYFMTLISGGLIRFNLSSIVNPLDPPKSKYIGLGYGDGLSFYSADEPILASPGLSRILELRIDKDRRLSIAEEEKQPFFSGGAISTVRDSRGNFYFLTLTGGSILKVPSVNFLPSWQRMEFFGSVEAGVALAMDKNDDLYALAAEYFPTPPPSSVVEGGGPPQPLPVPSRIVLFRNVLAPQRAKPLIVTEGGALNVFFSPINGFDVRDGEIFVSSRPSFSSWDSADEILKYTVGPDGRAIQFSRFLPSELAGRSTTFTALKVIE